MTGASLMTSGRVPNTVKIFMIDLLICRWKSRVKPKFVDLQRTRVAPENENPRQSKARLENRLSEVCTLPLAHERSAQASTLLRSDSETSTTWSPVNSG